jgi:hypothetical protein
MCTAQPARRKCFPICRFAFSLKRTNLILLLTCQLPPSITKKCPVPEKKKIAKFERKVSTSGQLIFGTLRATCRSLARHFIYISGGRIKLFGIHFRPLVACLDLSKPIGDHQKRLTFILLASFSQLWAHQLLMSLKVIRNLLL